MTAPRLMQVIRGKNLVGQLVFERYDRERDYWVCTKATSAMQHLVGLDLTRVEARLTPQHLTLLPISADSGSAPGAATSALKIQGASLSYGRHSNAVSDQPTGGVAGEGRTPLPSDDTLLTSHSGRAGLNPPPVTGETSPAPHIPTDDPSVWRILRRPPEAGLKAMGQD